MNKNYKEIFFDQGYVPNLKIFDKTYADNIYNEYLNFNHQNNNKKCDLVEHKTKTHLYFPWANKIIFHRFFGDPAASLLCLRRSWRTIKSMDIKYCHIKKYRSYKAL